MSETKKPYELTIYNSVWHRVVSVLAITIMSFTGLEALAYITNLYQPRIFSYLSVYVYLFLVMWLMYVFDTHFKRENYLLSFLRSLLHRIKHFLTWEHFRHFQNFLILPGIIYWGSVVLIGINLGHFVLQQFIVFASTAALVISMTLFKEVFRKGLGEVRHHHFVILGYIKIYAAWLIYSAILGITWYYCLPPDLFYLGIFVVTFMLFYQALFQIAAITLRSLLLVFCVSFLIAIVAYFVFWSWNVNYFSAGFLLAASYNFLWTLGLNGIKKTLTKDIFFEQLIFFVLVLVMVLSVTNFRAQIERC